jgi:hypothetical protein
MNEVMDMGNTMLNVGQTMEMLIATIVVGVLLSLFGLKLVRVLTTIVSLVLGAGVGLVISHLLGWSGLTVAIVTLGCAVVLAALSFFLYRMGVFLTVFVSVLGICISVMYPGTNLMLVIYLAAALVFAILSAIFVEPLVIVVTAVSGGVNAALAIVSLAGLSGNLLITVGIAAVIIIVGMIVQFMMHSRKIGKKEKKQAEIIKEKDSVESEVEKARLILDDFDDEDETED